MGNFQFQYLDFCIFEQKYYRPAVSDGHCHNRLLKLKLSALTTNVGPRQQPDHSCMQLAFINGKHIDKFPGSF